MDKTWIDKTKSTHEYVRGCEAFLDFAFRRSNKEDEKLCPCKNCKNIYYLNRYKIREHIIVDGFNPSYKIWTSHGERYGDSIIDPVEEYAGVGDDLVGMVNDACGVHDEGDGLCSDEDNEDGEDGDGFGTGPEGGSLDFMELLQDAERDLYPGCEKFTTLSFLIRILQLKVMHKFSNTCFDDLMSILKEAFHKGETLPTTYYEAKKFRDKLGFNYVKYDSCPNDCMLYWKDKAGLTNCEICAEPRYKTPELPEQNGERARKQVPKKQVRYFPVKDRLKRLFTSAKTAELMRWHGEELSVDENEMHPAHSKAWKKFNETHPTFDQDRRNVRLGLAADGFSPFKTMTTKYTVWPVVLIPYNLPPWLCTKPSFLMLSLLIDGQRQPGNDIDVYLQPLIEDLKDFWDEGVRTYDASTSSMFQLRAALMWTINDFPAYANLSGWSTKGKLACPICMEQTDFRWLSSGHKISYGGHRRFLPADHPFRKDKRNFVDKLEHRNRPPNLSGEEVWEQVKDIQNKFGKIPTKPTNKKRARTKSRCDEEDLPGNWKKCSIFFELPYWKYNMVRHNLDVMHIEKNVCESIISTLLDVSTKTKFNDKSRQDLESMGIRKSLHIVKNGPNSKSKRQAAPFTLSNEQKKEFLQILKDVRFPDSYASNISRCVNVEKKTIQGLKSHDYHVLLQQLLPIAIRKVLPKNIAKPLIELCNYFRQLCSRGLKGVDLDRLSERIVLTLCHLEKIFPPSFFDVMVHLTVHLADEADFGGSVHMRWMYPVERFFKTLKDYVRQNNHVEGSIAEGYLAEECLVFCSRYLDETVKTKLNRPERYTEGPLGQQKTRYLKQTEREQAHRYVLANSRCMDPLKVKHVDEMRSQYPTAAEYWLLGKHHDEFPDWLKDYVANEGRDDPDVTNDVKVLSRGLNHWAVSFTQGYTINGRKYHTKNHSKGLLCQNDGVMLEASTSSFATTRDRFPVLGDVNYYGRLIDVVEICYSTEVKFIMFKCEWIDNNRGCRVDEYGCTLVNFDHLLYKKDTYKDEPFILASQAEQVWYVDDGNKWKVVVPMKPTSSYKDQGMNAAAEICPDAEPFAEQQLDQLGEEIGDGRSDDSDDDSDDSDRDNVDGESDSNDSDEDDSDSDSIDDEDGIEDGNNSDF